MSRAEPDRVIAPASWLVYCMPELGAGCRIIYMRQQTFFTIFKKIYKFFNTAIITFHKNIIFNIAFMYIFYIIFKLF